MTHRITKGSTRSVKREAIQTMGANPLACIYMTGGAGWGRHMIDKASLAEVMLSSAFSLHASQRRQPLSCPRAKVWFRRHRHSLAEMAMAAVRENRTRIIPERFEKVYFNWLENIEDWCVSRQLWWGHRIPVWYLPDGTYVVPEPDEAPPAGAGDSESPQAGPARGS